jgi:hypothetical protein
MYYLQPHLNKNVIYYGSKLTYLEQFIGGQAHAHCMHTMHTMHTFQNLPDHRK